MVTKEQAMTAREFHYGRCSCRVGPRGGKTVKVETWRRNGATVTWKRSPDAFRVPVKYGLATYGAIDNNTASLFHTAEDCPLNKEES